jgi:hypothetical protein
MADKSTVEHGSMPARAKSESSIFDEKHGLRTVDQGLSADQVVVEYDQGETRRIMRKIDYRLIPLLSVLYL